MGLRELLEKSIFDQTDETLSAPLSIRLPIRLSNELDEIASTLDKSKSFLLLEFVKAGIIETNNFLLEKDKLEFEIEEEKDMNEIKKTKYFMLNTNFNNDKSAHLDMLENQEVAAFYKGFREKICKLSEGDIVYLYQSGVGFIASGTVTGELLKNDYKGKKDGKYSKKLKDFKFGFKAISARDFKKLTNSGANFRTTLVKLTLEQGSELEREIKKRTGL